MTELAAQLCGALRGEEAAAVEALLKQGADPNLVLPEGVAAVHLAAGKERESGVRCLQLVLQYGGDPNARSAEELTPLHVAASWGCYKCLKLLLRKGGDPDLEDQDGSRAIDLAMEQGNTMCVQILQDFQRARAWPEFSPDGPGRAGSPPQPLTADSTDCSVFSWLSEAGSAPPSSTRKWLPNGSPREMGLDVAFPDTTGSQAEPPPTWFCFSTRRDPGARGQPAWPQPLLCSTLLSTSNGPRGGAWSLPAAPEEEPAEAEDSLAQLGTLQPWHCPHGTQQLGPRAALHAGEALLDETVAVHSPWQPGSTRQTPGSASPCESHSPLPSCSSRDTREPCPVPHSLAQPDGFLDPATRDWEGLDATSPDHAYLFCWAHSTALHNLDKTVMVPASLEKAPEISSGPLESNNSQYSSCDSECYVSTVEASDPVEAGRDGSASKDAWGTGRSMWQCPGKQLVLGPQGQSLKTPALGRAFVQDMPPSRLQLAEVAGESRGDVCQGTHFFGESGGLRPAGKPALVLHAGSTENSPCPRCAGSQSPTQTPQHAQPVEHGPRQGSNGATSLSLPRAPCRLAPADLGTEDSGPGRAAPSGDCRLGMAELAMLGQPEGRQLRAQHSPAARASPRCGQGRREGQSQAWGLSARGSDLGTADTVPLSRATGGTADTVLLSRATGGTADTVLLSRATGGKADTVPLSRATGGTADTVPLSRATGGMADTVLLSRATGGTADTVPLSRATGGTADTVPLSRATGGTADTVPLSRATGGMADTVLLSRATGGMADTVLLSRATGGTADTVPLSRAMADTVLLSRATGGMADTVLLSRATGGTADTVPLSRAMADTVPLSRATGGTADTVPLSRAMADTVLLSRATGGMADTVPLSRATGGTVDTVLLSRATGGTADTVPLSRAMADTVPLSRATGGTADTVPLSRAMADTVPLSRAMADTVPLSRATGGMADTVPLSRATGGTVDTVLLSRATGGTADTVPLSRAMADTVPLSRATGGTADTVPLSRAMADTVPLSRAMADTVPLSRATGGMADTVPLSRATGGTADTVPLSRATGGTADTVPLSRATGGTADTVPLSRAMADTVPLSRATGGTADTVLLSRATGGTADTVPLSRAMADTVPLSRATGGTADTVPLSRAMAGTVPMSRAGENTDGEESEASALLLQCLGSPDSAPRGTSFANSTGTPRSSSLPPCLAHCHITPRTKSRLYASTARGNSSSSSSSLFDETLELPQRTQRVRRPPETSRTPVSRAGGLLESTRASYCEAVESGSLDETVVLLPAASLPAASGQSSAPSTSPTVLQSPAGVTRLHAPETTGPCPPRMEHPSTAGPPSSPPGPGESSWLTEEDCTECPGLGAPVRPPTTTTSTQDWFGSELGSVEPSQSLAQGLGGLQLGGKKPSSRSRVSFSRLSATRPALAAPGSGRLSPVLDTDDPGIPLSPGGRPTNHGAGEAVEYLYLDEEKGHALIERHVPPTENTCCSDTSSEDTIIYDWRACASQRGAKENRLVPACSDEALLRKLQKLGADPGPVTDSTRNLYMQQLNRLQSSPGARAGRGATGHSPELSAALETLQIPDCQADEVALAAQFDQPDKARKWREGVLKSSFNYLLLDPRVTQNLPLRCHTLSPAERFQTFVRAIFYVGKGKRARPYCHLYEALAHYRGGKKQACAKVRHILDIWAGGQGVVSVHCFQNVIPVEAYTREACMVDALGLAMLTNQKRGNCYGVAAGWIPRRRRRLGVHLLHRALQIFLAEGERQLRPADIQVGQ